MCCLLFQWLRDQVCNVRFTNKTAEHDSNDENAPKRRKTDKSDKEVLYITIITESILVYF